jgi:hypothetical protein
MGTKGGRNTLLLLQLNTCVNCSTVHQPILPDILPTHSLGLPHR